MIDINDIIDITEAIEIEITLGEQGGGGAVGTRSFTARALSRGQCCF